MSCEIYLKKSTSYESAIHLRDGLKCFNISTEKKERKKKYRNDVLGGQIGLRTSPGAFRFHNQTLRLDF